MASYMEMGAEKPVYLQSKELARRISKDKIAKYRVWLQNLEPRNA